MTHLNHVVIKSIIQWDVKAWSKALLYWDKNVEWDNIHNSLELGGREGGLSLWLALKGKTVICSNLRDVEKTATPLHSQYKVSSFIKYQDIDATNIPFENAFDLIVFKSIAGAIGINENDTLQKKLFKEIHKALKPQGILLFAENLAASSLHQLLRKKFVKWGESWRYVSLEELADFMKDFNVVDIRTTGVFGAFGRSELQREILSTLDSMFFNRIFGDRYKYIAYGMAKK